MTSLLFLLCMMVQCCIGTKPQPQRQTDNGVVAGVIQTGLPKGNVEVFYGIPFAQPPVGDLRFEDPRSPFNWDGVRQATTLPSACSQHTEGVDYMLYHRLGLNYTSEDCLYLSVFTPVKTNKTNMAVLIFIHGGSNMYGTGLMFDGSHLASYGQIVVVIINYRLTVLGFLGAGKPDFRGNYGMMDQIMAMRWVKKNIKHFSGDPDKVTVLGHSSGAMNVGIHLVSPLSRGLFRALISQSGPPTTPTAWKNLRKDPEKEVRYVAHTFGCKNSTLRDMKQCLKTLPAAVIIKGDLTCSEKDVMLCYVLVDGLILPEEPEILLRKRQFNANNYVIGYTTSEDDDYALYYNFSGIMTMLQVYGILPTTLNISDTLNFEYTDWERPNEEASRKKSLSDLSSDAWCVADSVLTANLASDGGVHTYLYQWDHAPSKKINSNLKPWMDVPHGIDLFYLFGSPLTGHHSFNFTDLDEKMSYLMMESWSNYVIHGVLSPTTNLQVNRGHSYDSTNKTYLRFHARNGRPELTVEHNPRPRQVYFWNSYLPRLTKRLLQTGHTNHTTPTSIAYSYDTKWPCYLTSTILLFFNQIY